ncbi:hypothetical protein [Glycomyces buryatensis]|uniref:Peptidase M23 n=1 Tax=Glycomyces buryatensis TaxID=2570927 RepID=A0A4V4HSQ3_9ACTN|nr:hypothetical protein [Glycomyces buryatensis]THV42626.1 hypothetical protein FAB82_05515 [Glycomyces buryatensis]
MREQTSPDEPQADPDSELALYEARRRARENAPDSGRRGHHRRRSKVLRRLAAASAAAVVATGTAGAAGATLSDADDPTVEERVARTIVAEAIGADYDWDNVEAMPSIMPMKEAAGTVAPAAAKSEANEIPPTVNADAAPVGGLDETQMGNAAAIIQAGMDRGLGERAWAVALATAMQESKFYNSANPVVPASYDYDWDIEYSDHDSIGLFQQRPSMGWGTVAELMDPRASAAKFYGTLEDVSGWEDMSIASAAQAVQISAYPDYYAQWEDLAWDIIDAQVG